MFHATDETEQTDIRKYISSKSNILVAPCLPRMDKVEWKSVTKEENKLKAIFISRIVPKKNLSYLLDCLTKVNNAYEISLDIYGESEDKNYYQHCIEIQHSLTGKVTATFRGPINNNLLEELYSEYHVFMLPTLGENFGYAIFEALLYGKPILISDKTPWTNLAPQKIGFDLPLDKAAAYVQAIEFFVSMRQHEYDEWSKNAWLFAQQFQNITELKEKYRQLF